MHRQEDFKKHKLFQGLSENVRNRCQPNKGCLPADRGGLRNGDPVFPPVRS
jgi:hypothetical protein